MIIGFAILFVVIIVSAIAWIRGNHAKALIFLAVLLIPFAIFGSVNYYQNSFNLPKSNSKVAISSPSANDVSAALSADIREIQDSLSQIEDSVSSQKEIRDNLPKPVVKTEVVELPLGPLIAEKYAYHSPFPRFEDAPDYLWQYQWDGTGGGAGGGGTPTGPSTYPGHGEGLMNPSLRDPNDAISLLDVPEDCEAQVGERSVLFGTQLVEVTIDCQKSRQAKLDEADEKLISLEKIAQEERSKLIKRRALRRYLLEIAGSSNMDLALDSPKPLCKSCDYAGFANIRYTDPSSMQLEEPIELALALVPELADIDPDKVIDTERFSGKIRSAESMKFSLRMRAQLDGASIDFEIKPDGWVERNILTTNEPMKWDWKVTPLRPGGNKLLTFKLESLLTVGENGQGAFSPESRTIKINVDVDPWGRAVYMADQIETVHAAAVGAGGLIVAVIAWFFGLFKKREPPKPIQVEIKLKSNDPDIDDTPDEKAVIETEVIEMDQSENKT